MSDPASDPPLPVRVWDLPTRVFHWAITCGVVASVASAKIGGAAMVWHFRFGYVAIVLLGFRLLWGVVGGRWSRFASFVYAPAALLRFVRGDVRPGDRYEVGHSPLGALSVFAMLAVLVAQVCTGLVADDEIANVGPLNRFVATATGLSATAWHKQGGQGLLLALVALHVGAILWYRFGKGKDLIRPMLDGDKWLPAGTPGARDDLATRLLALLLAAICAGAVVLMLRLAA
jgi:cytochrome b